MSQEENKSEKTITPTNKKLLLIAGCLLLFGVLLGVLIPFSAKQESLADETIKAETEQKQTNIEEEQMIRLKTGDKAPNFKLLDQDNNEVQLTDFTGKKILLYFYPKADTPGCTAQACSVRDSAEPLQELGVVTLGISPDEPDAQKEFDEKYNLGFRLLSDSDHKASKAYGVWGEKTIYGKKYMGITRSSFLIDEQGKIIQAWYNVSPADTVPNALYALK
ncbi:MAG: thioredoxin-dependent thiol peroxidase [Phycisphaerae bacterium]